MSGLNLLVFRGDQRRVSGQDMKAELARKLEQLCVCCNRDALLDALLLAGELECGTADADGKAARPCEFLTDKIAMAFLRAESGTTCQNESVQYLLDLSLALPALEQLSISTPEGFAYYALHPLFYADAVNQICGPEPSLLVVGIRSIGTTLSAVVAAAARLRGMKAQRITVRPEGHPYNRSAEFSPEQLAVIEHNVSACATFAVVDEGPGLSGSSFLAVAEALERSGAPLDKIVLVSSHAPNVDALCATDAAQRWRRFRGVAVEAETRRPAEAADFIGGGHWRRFIANDAEWPASWTSFERLKYVPSMEHGERRLFKFAGLGRYGDQTLEREREVAAAGFGPWPRKESDGFVSYPWIDGRPLSASDLSEAVIARLAEYCAFRLHAFAVELSDLDALQKMAEYNVRELGMELPVELRLERPVIADGRMQSYEWLLMHDGQLLKTDSGSHGDDHFFPGPTDIAWDLAGAIIEWKMNEQQTRKFLDLYRCSSGDDASTRIHGFIKAYAAFRAAYCMMAANAMSGSDEQQRLQQAAAAYRLVLTQVESRALAAV